MTTDPEMTIDDETTGGETTTDRETTGGEKMIGYEMTVANLNHPINHRLVHLESIPLRPNIPSPPLSDQDLRLLPLDPKAKKRNSV